MKKDSLNLDPFEIILNILLAMEMKRNLSIELIFSRYEKEKKIMEDLDWLLIFNVFNDEYDKLWDSLKVDGNIEDYILKRFLYKYSVWYLIKDHFISVLKFTLYHIKNEKIFSTIKLNEKVKVNLSKRLKVLFMILSIPVSIINIDKKSIVDLLGIDADSDEIIKKYELGKKLSKGKGYQKSELKAYKKAHEKYIEAVNKGDKRSRKKNSFIYS